MSRFQSLLAVKISTFPRSVFRTGTDLSGLDVADFRLEFRDFPCSFAGSFADNANPFRTSVGCRVMLSDETSWGVEAELSGDTGTARTECSAEADVKTEDSDFPNESAIVPRKKDVTATSRYRGGCLDGFMIDRSSIDGVVG
tara:strand:- start:403538 stop:403963 length:426 start_codon:yes stop_codon:yes gene_type:complete